MNLINMHETKQINKLMIKNDSTFMLNDEVYGAKLVLTRLIGHRELEPV